jgi:hypothetical protein
MEFEEWRKTLPDIFEKVKKDVYNTVRRHRAGLVLGLVEMGMHRGGFIGGMFFSGGTMIIFNTTPLRIILSQHTDEIVWAYTYHILLHEYIHSLGALDEIQTRQISLEISEKIFKNPEHPTVVIARRGIGAYFPNLPLIYAPFNFNPKGLKIDVVKEFDKGSQTYYS